MWSVVARFTTVGEAESARSALDAAGIDARVGDENMVAVDWLMSQAVGGVKVLVPEEKLEEAAEVLGSGAAEPASDQDEEGRAEARPTSLREYGPLPEASDIEEPLCPRCGSREYYRVTWRRLRASSLILQFGAFLIVPLWLVLPKWKCDTCGLRRWFR